MRFHTSLTLADIQSVELPRGVRWHRVREHGSRSRARGFEIILEGNSKHGGQWGDLDYKAATWDEWGVVLGRLFDLDPNARVARVYEGAEHFHYCTGERFAPNGLPERLCPRHKWDPNYDCTATCKKCHAVRRWDWHPDPEPRDDTASQRREGTEPRVWTVTSADFLAGRTTPPRQHRSEPVEVDAYGERYTPDPELGKYASGGAYKRDLLSRIDELISGAP